MVSDPAESVFIRQRCLFPTRSFCTTFEHFSAFFFRFQNLMVYETVLQARLVLLLNAGYILIIKCLHRSQKFQHTELVQKWVFIAHFFISSLLSNVKLLQAFNVSIFFTHLHINISQVPILVRKQYTPLADFNAVKQ